MDILPNKTTNINILEKTNQTPQPKEEKAGGLKFPGIPSFPKMGNYVYETKWPLAAGIILLFLIAVVWAGLFFYNKSLSQEKEALDQKMVEFKKEENKEMVAKIISLENGITLAKGLLAAHKYPSKIFTFLEETTISNVVWEDFSFDEKNTEILLDGRAQTFSVIAKQIAILEGDERVSSISVSGAQLDQAGGASFSAKIIFNPKILR